MNPHRVKAAFAVFIMTIQIKDDSLVKFAWQYRGKLILNRDLSVYRSKLLNVWKNLVGLVFFRLMTVCGGH